MHKLLLINLLLVVLCFFACPHLSYADITNAKDCSKTSVSCTTNSGDPLHSSNIYYNDSCLGSCNSYGYSCSKQDGSTGTCIPNPHYPTATNVETCSGYDSSDTNHNYLRSGICYYVVSTGQGYTDDPNISSPHSIYSCGTIGGIGLPNSCSAPLPSCSYMTTHDYHKDPHYHGIDITDLSTNCQDNTDAGTATKCCSPDGITPIPQNPCPKQNGICTKVDTALGTINVGNFGEFIKVVFATLLSLSGGVAMILIIFSGYRLMTAQGDPERMKGAREMITSAIVGLLFLIFSVTILQILGFDILHLPGFGK